MEDLKNKICGVYSVVQLYDEVESKGLAKIKRFSISRNEAIMYNMRSNDMMRIREGTYCKLIVDGELMMSDTPMERLSNLDFINNANGRVLIAGLGIGMIINAILDKKDVTEVIVIEKYQDVIDLVLPKIQHPKLKVICADIFDYKPIKGDKYDVIYFDIWANISQDNLTEMKTLANKFKYAINRDNCRCWMNSWMKEYLQKERRKDLREEKSGYKSWFM